MNHLHAPKKSRPGNPGFCLNIDCAKKGEIPTTKSAQDAAEHQPEKLERFRIIYADRRRLLRVPVVATSRAAVTRTARRLFGTSLRGVEAA